MSDKNKILFENLINRLALNVSTGEYTLPGVITSDERSALLHYQKYNDVVLSSSVTVDTAPSSDSQIIAHEPESASAPILEASKVGGITSEGIEKLLNTDVLAPKDFQEGIKLGIDFGTAYSKACMMETSDGEETILDLPLGIFAGEDALEMPVHSSLFIDPDGRLYFGPIAVEKSEEARAVGLAVSRIDSIKSFLIDEERVTIDDSPLPKTYNPTSVEVSKAALLTFYLGYLLYLVRVAAKDRHGIDISTIKRRISLPCYAPGHREKVIREISKLFSMGEVLGVSFDVEWESGFRIDDVKYLYDWMRTNIDCDSPYIERFLEEPLAVASSRLSLGGLSRGNVCMVVDVGAGTTDFAMFEIFANANNGYNRAKELKGSEYGVPFAGDKLDSILLAFILKDAGITRGSENYRNLVLSLRLDIRDYKEKLFRSNSLTYSLPGGTTGEIKLSDFLQDKSVNQFSSELKKAFVHVLSSIHPSWINTKIQQKNDLSALPVILTGGGASLPMVRNLAKGVVEINGQSVKLSLSSLVPKWIMDNYEGELINLYPQLAVSLGSAKQFVIEKTGVTEEYL